MYAGLTRSSDTVSSWPLRRSVTVLSERRSTLNGPSYGDSSDAREASLRTKTCVQCRRSAGTNTGAEDEERGAVGRIRRMCRRS